MSGTPFMQFYPGDYLGKTMDLTTEQHGAYLLILMTMWQHDAKLPNDPKKLARIARLTPVKFNAVWAEISRFFDVDGEVITNPRMTKERKKAAEKSQKRAVSGSAGGKAKALKDKEARIANAAVLPCHSPDARYQSEEREEANASLCERPKPSSANRFPDFWDAYPHRNGAKKGRADCERVYAKAVKAGVTEQQIIDAAGRAREDPDVKRGYGRSALPWLNQRGWEDEIQPQSNLTVIHGSNHDRQSPQQNRQSAADDRFGRIADAAVRNRAPSGADFGFG